MKKDYTTPTMKVFVISSDERLAAACGGATFTYSGWGCTDLLMDGLGEESCNNGGNYSS